MEILRIIITVRANIDKDRNVKKNILHLHKKNICRYNGLRRLSFFFISNIFKYINTSDLLNRKI